MSVAMNNWRQAWVTTKMVTLVISTVGPTTIPAISAVRSVRTGNGDGGIGGPSVVRPTCAQRWRWRPNRSTSYDPTGV